MDGKTEMIKREHKFKHCLTQRFNNCSILSLWLSPLLPLTTLPSFTHYHHLPFLDLLNYQFSPLYLKGLSVCASSVVSDSLPPYEP